MQHGVPARAPGRCPVGVRRTRSKGMAAYSLARMDHETLSLAQTGRWVERMYPTWRGGQIYYSCFLLWPVRIQLGSSTRKEQRKINCGCALQSSAVHFDALLSLRKCQHTTVEVCGMHCGVRKRHIGRRLSRLVNQRQSHRPHVQKRWCLPRDEWGWHVKD